jgi:3-hydroxyacyl-[acyl-carrier-protein] dehydratase
VNVAPLSVPVLAAAPLAASPAEKPAVLDRAAIERHLPHRGDILFVHQVEVLTADHFAGTASWDASLPALKGHFPGHSIVPAVFLIEAAAQIAGVGLRTRSQDARLGVLAMIQRCKFLRPVQPGQEVRFALTVDKVTGGFAAVSGRAFVNATRVAELAFVLGLASTGPSPSADP